MVTTLDLMTHSMEPKIGTAVVHLFVKVAPLADFNEIVSSIDKFLVGDNQLISVSLLGHKADMGFMAIAKDLWHLRELQTSLQLSGLDVVDSYTSVTEVSEYADGLPEEMKQTRLYPNLPPEGMSAWCFYPMSKRRNPGQNWFTTDFDRRKELMMQHGKSGKEFRGRVVQLVTGSTGLDDYEWGVTLFGLNPDDLKDAVYTMRFDEASAEYGEFGTFYTGMVASPEKVLASVGLKP